MKFLSLFTLIFTFQLFAAESITDSATDAKAPENVSDEETTDSSNILEEDTETSKKEIEADGISEEEALIKFLIEEVFSAFGGFQDIFFSKPSFDIHWTPEGMQIKNCSLKLQLKQLRALRYNLADMELYGFRSDAEIGGPRWLFVQMSCDQTKGIENKTHFKVKFFVTDEDLNPSYYSLKIKTMDKEQFDIKLQSIEMGVDIETVDDVLLSDSYGHVEILPNDSPFLRFFEEEKAYAEEVEEVSTDDSLTEVGPKNIYDINSRVWDQIKKTSSEEESLIPLKKMNINQVINVKGAAEISLPVYKEGAKEEVRVVIPVEGHIFSSVDGEIVPIIDISIN